MFTENSHQIAKRQGQLARVASNHIAFLPRLFDRSPAIREDGDMNVIVVVSVHGRFFAVISITVQYVEGSRDLVLVIVALLR